MDEMKVRKLIVEVLEKEESAILGISTNEDLSIYGLNSLTGIKLIVRIEQIFDIEILDDEDLLFSNSLTIEKCMNLIEKYKAF